jgi:hypothetical protein
MLEVSRVIDVGAPGGTSGNFKSWPRTISLQAVVRPGSPSTGVQKKKKKKKKKKGLINYPTLI